MSDDRIGVAADFIRASARAKIADILLFVAVAAGLIYMVVLVLHIDLTLNLLLIAKVSPTAFLGIAALMRAENVTRFLLALALLVSCVGDLFTLLPVPTATAISLNAFTIAVLLYMLLFLGNMQRLGHIHSAKLKLASMFLASAMLFAFYIYPRLYATDSSVIAFMIAVSIMIIVAVLSRFELRLAGLGAVLFGLSAAALALKEFDLVPSITSHPLFYLHADAASWFLYLSAQLLILIGISAAPDKSFLRN